jgi:hypothetical protein
MGFKIGDTVRDGWGVYLILAVERQDDPSLGSALDMGRYTLRRQDGDGLHYNMPGYLLRAVKEETK